MKAVPDTSSLPAGLVLPIPTFPPDSKMAEFSMLQALVNLAIWLPAAVPSLVMDEQAACGDTSNGSAPETGTRTCRSEERRVGKEWRYWRDWSSDVCSSDLAIWLPAAVPSLVMDEQAACGDTSNGSAPEPGTRTCGRLCELPEPIPASDAG